MAIVTVAVSWNLLRNAGSVSAGKREGKRPIR
jgi:hypothetical protein